MSLRQWIDTDPLPRQAADLAGAAAHPLRPDFAEAGTLSRSFSARCLSISSQLLDALDHLHDRDVAHRDVKPDNIMLDGNGDVVLIDFATAWAAGGLVGAGRDLGHVELGPARGTANDDELNMEGVAALLAQVEVGTG